MSEVIVVSYEWGGDAQWEVIGVASNLEAAKALVTAHEHWDEEAVAKRSADGQVHWDDDGPHIFLKNLRHGGRFPCHLDYSFERFVVH